MISQNSYKAAACAALELNDRKISLAARQGSILGELVDLSSNLIIPEGTPTPMSVAISGNQNVIGMRTIEDRACDVEYMTSNAVNSSQHSLKIMALADDIAPFVTSHISFARNVVAPMVDHYAGELAKFMSTARPMDPAAEFEIRQRELPELLLDESFLADGLKNYIGLNVSWKPFQNTLPGHGDNPDFFANLANVGNARQNELVAKWLRVVGSDYLKGVYLNTFTTEHYENKDNAYLGSLVGDPGVYQNPYESLDHSLALYLISTRLMSEVQPAEGLSLIAYKQKMRDVVDYSGAMVMRSLSAIQRQISSNVVVTEAILSKKQITVNKVVYLRWITEGGCPEALLGMVVSGNVLYNIAAISEAKEKLVSMWQSYLVLANTSVAAEMQKRFTNFALSTALLDLDNQSAMEADYCTGKTGIKDVLTRKIRAVFEELEHCAMDDVTYTALAVIAKGRFYYTSAFAILNEMREVAKINPDADPREAALLSTISYGVDYLLEQIIALK